MLPRRKKLGLILVLGPALIFLLGFIVSDLKSQSVYAQEEANVHIKLEASADNGATWHNFSGTEYSGNETINANAGDRIKLKVKVWNSSTEENATSISGIGAANDTTYIDSVDIISNNEDGDATTFDGFIFSDHGTSTLARANKNGSENSGYQSMTGYITLSNDIPQNETIILAETTIQDFDSELIVNNPFQFIQKAKAEGQGRKSAIRIAINNIPTELPAVGIPIWPYFSLLMIIFIFNSFRLIKKNPNYLKR